MIDTEDPVQVLDILKIYGADGWKFVGWTEIKRNKESIRGAILEKENE